MKLFFLVILAFAACLASAQQQEIWVDASFNSTGQACGNMTSPCGSLQDGVNSINSTNFTSSIIYIANGTYADVIVPANVADVTFSGASRDVFICNMESLAESIVIENVAFSHCNGTALHVQGGNVSISGVEFSYNNNSGLFNDGAVAIDINCSLFLANNRTALVSNRQSTLLTVRQSYFLNNVASGDGDSGSAMFVTSHLTLIDSVFEGNVWSGDGDRYAAAVHADSFAHTTVTGCIFHRNHNGNTGSWPLGGAIAAVDRRTVTITNSIFTENSVLEGEGAAVFLSNDDNVIDGCYFYENEIAPAFRGGAAIYAGDANISNSVFYGQSGGSTINTRTRSFGFTATFFITNNTFLNTTEPVEINSDIIGHIYDNTFSCNFNVNQFSSSLCNDIDVARGTAYVNYSTPETFPSISSSSLDLTLVVINGTETFLETQGCVGRAESRCDGSLELPALPFTREDLVANCITDFVFPTPPPTPSPSPSPSPSPTFNASQTTTTTSGSATSGNSGTTTTGTSGNQTTTGNIINTSGANAVVLSVFLLVVALALL